MGECMSGMAGQNSRVHIQIVPYSTQGSTTSSKYVLNDKDMAWVKLARVNKSKIRYNELTILMGYLNMYAKG